jgi:LuxR family maltose regulon positive regulatory protein
LFLVVPDDADTGPLADASDEDSWGITVDNPGSALRRGHIWLADIYRAWNDLDRAREQLERADDVSAFLEAECFLPCQEVAWASLHWANGNPQQAFEALTEGIRRASLAENVTAVRQAEAVRAGFMLRQGRLDAVAEWARAAGLSPDMPPDYPHLEEELVYAHLLIVDGRPNLALPLLARLRASAEADGRVIDTGRILILEVLAQQAQNQPGLARDTLAAAIALLAPSGHVRVFADEGPALVPLLRRLAVTGVHLDYVGALLRAVGDGLPLAPDATGGLIDPLSNRELEVLRLVSVGLSNREISDQLFISVPTVKRHISTILEKLSANSRTQAVSVARSLQLI